METTGRPVPEKETHTDPDFAALPEGAPYELIQGEVVMAPSPTTAGTAATAATPGSFTPAPPPLPSSPVLPSR